MIESCWVLDPSARLRVTKVLQTLPRPADDPENPRISKSNSRGPENPVVRLDPAFIDTTPLAPSGEQKGGEVTPKNIGNGTGGIDVSPPPRPRRKSACASFYCNFPLIMSRNRKILLLLTGGYLLDDSIFIFEVNFSLRE